MGSGQVPFIMNWSFTPESEDADDYTAGLGYAPGIEDLAEKISILQGLFPELGGINSDYLAEIKAGKISISKKAKMLVPIINWEQSSNRFGNTYHDAVEKIFLKLRELDSCFDNSCKGKMGPEYLRQSERSINFWRKIAKEQGNPSIIIVPVQYRSRHRGYNQSDARESMAPNECGLGVFQFPNIALTNNPIYNNQSGRSYYGTETIHCIGDEYSEHADGTFSESIAFNFYEEWTHCSSCYISHKCVGHWNCNPTAFMPR